MRGRSKSRFACSRACVRSRGRFTKRSCVVRKLRSIRPWTAPSVRQSTRYLVRGVPCESGSEYSKVRGRPLPTATAPFTSLSLTAFGMAAVANNVGGFGFSFAIRAAISAPRLGRAVTAWVRALIGSLGHDESPEQEMRFDRTYVSAKRACWDATPASWPLHFAVSADRVSRGASV